MVGFLATTLLLQGPIALPDHAMRLDALLKALSAASGETYRVQGSMAGRIEFCGGPPRPPAAIRADLATANWGVWNHSDGAWRLEEDRAGVAARERERLAGRLAAVQAAQAKLRGTARPFDESTAREIAENLDRMDKAEKDRANDLYAYFSKVETILPSTVALRRLVSGIDPKALVSLERGRVAFSDVPTRLQRPLGPDAGSALRDLARDQNVWAAVYTEGDAFHEGRNHWFSADPRAHAEPVPEGDLRAIVAAEANAGNGLRFSGKFFDAQGREQMEGYLNVEISVQASREDPEPTVDPKEPDTPVSEVARAYSAARQEAPNATDRAIFLSPNRTEPLDVLVGEGCRETVKALGKPLTVWLDDSLLDLSLGKDKGLSPHGWLRAFWRRDYVVREGADAVVLQPRHEVGNVDRRLLAELVQATDRAGFLPFENAADYAAAEPRMPDADAQRAVEIAVAAVMPGAYETARPEWDFLRLWGGFSPVQRETLRNGGTVPWIAVSKPLQSEFVEAMLQSGPNDIRPDVQRSSKGRDIDREPSEVLASDIGMGDGVRGEGWTRPSVMGRDPMSPSWYAAGTADPSTMARAVLAREKDPNGEFRDGMPKALPTAYVLGRQFSVGLSVPLGTQMVWRRSAYVGEFDLRSSPAPSNRSPRASSSPIESRWTECGRIRRREDPDYRRNPPSPFPLPFSYVLHR